MGTLSLTKNFCNDETGKTLYTMFSVRQKSCTGLWYTVFGGSDFSQNGEFAGAKPSGKEMVIWQ
ncbi:hypothetical protein RUMCAL_01035 [Ruminococcus callidus ATCC 27760]|uniref:Uncharacterized protein n=1 Tax=Ruminococcus callidus ATCC 27760 TaxID=411473 RepID=U2KDL1_9FIRM|nr:hypothetical protein RUMCAL_01035 [Ruminococcus callidus ATCC 27760]